mmetsp:Transcript_14620/g.25023  ORF Transcript_14620/g.25023 Transcript_14620/m.25023 type:complete len:85 (+) Transcript_14620:513-767(+)
MQHQQHFPFLMVCCNLIFFTNQQNSKKHKKKSQDNVTTATNDVNVTAGYESTPKFETLTSVEPSHVPSGQYQQVDKSEWEKYQN